MSDIPPPPAQPAYGAVPPSPPVGADYASWLSRVGANLLDGLVNFAVAIPLVAPGVAVLISTSDLGSPSPLGIGLVVLGYLAVFVFAIWNFVIRQGRKGQTLGKTWLHIKVVRDANGEIPGVWLALGRYFLQSILTPLTLYLNLLWPLWDAKKQTLHDKVCSTVVIRVP